jgi:hypothetical protein
LTLAVELGGGADAVTLVLVAVANILDGASSFAVWP